MPPLPPIAYIHDLDFDVINFQNNTIWLTCGVRYRSISGGRGGVAKQFLRFVSTMVHDEIK